MHNKLYTNTIKSRLGERGQTQGAYSTYVTKCECRCSTKYRLDCKSVLTQKLQIKSLTSSGKFSGYASVFNNIDSYNDIVLPGAFKNAEAHSVKLLWQHDPKAIIAKIEYLQETHHGLLIEAILFIDTQQGQASYKLMERGVLDGLSIGYGIVEELFEDGLRYIKDLKLWEISLVTFTANEQARVINLKDDETKLLKAIERGIQVLRSH